MSLTRKINPRNRNVSNSDLTVSTTDWSLPMAIGADVLFALGVIVAAPFVIFALAITVITAPVVILAICAVLVIGMLAAALTMCACKLYDYCTEHEREVQQVADVLAVVNKSHEITSGSEKREGKGKEKESSSALKEVEEKVVLMDAPVVKRNTGSAESFTASAKILPSAGQFSLQSVPAEPLLPREGNVFLIDGTEALREQVDAIYERFQYYTSTEALAGLALLFDVCSKPLESRERILKAQSRTFSRFRASDIYEDNKYPIIKSDNTMDEETKRILLLALDKTPNGTIQFVKPFVEPVAVATPRL